MTDWAAIWALPGPAGYVADLASSVGSGRHTIALLPAWLCEEDLTDSLLAAVMAEVDRARGVRMRRVYPEPDSGTLAAAIGREAAWDGDSAPTTLDELLGHEDLAGNCYSLASGDLRGRLASELPEFLRRLSTGSRPLASQERPTLLVVGHQGQLLTATNQDLSDVAVTVVWFWNRLARWDLAALLAAHSDVEREAGIVHEVRMEAVIEVARWNLPLALKLWSAWSGDPGDLPHHLDGESGVEPPPTPPRSTPGTHPPVTWLTHWDAGAAEGWHDTLAVHPLAETGPASDPQRWIWLAQARVLLPWIEAKRIKVYNKVRVGLGSKFEEVLEDSGRWSRTDGAVDEAVLEVKDLAWIVRKYLSTDSSLKLAANELWQTRNEIAHLRPLSTRRLKVLVKACTFLG